MLALSQLPHNFPAISPQFIAVGLAAPSAPLPPSSRGLVRFIRCNTKLRISTLPCLESHRQVPTPFQHLRCLGPSPPARRGCWVPVARRVASDATVGLGPFREPDPTRNRVPPNPLCIPCANRGPQARRAAKPFALYPSPPLYSPLPCPPPRSLPPSPSPSPPPSPSSPSFLSSNCSSSPWSRSSRATPAPSAGRRPAWSSSSSWPSTIWSRRPPSSSPCGMPRRPPLPLPRRARSHQRYADPFKGLGTAEGPRCSRGIAWDPGCLCGAGRTGPSLPPSGLSLRTLLLVRDSP